MRTALTIAFVVLGVAAGVAAGWLLRGEAEPPPAPPVAVTSGEGPPAAFDSLQAALRRTRARFERLPPPTNDEEAALRRPRTPAYQVHLDRGEDLGVPRVTSIAQIDALVAEGRLAPLVDTEHYVVRTLEHSAPFVTPDLLRLLEEIGERFREGLDERGLPPYRFVLSSALRTPALQEDLRESNRNAATAASSHEYGVSVDIVNWRYVHAPDSAFVLDLPSGTPHPEAYRALYDEALAAYGYRYWDHLFGLMTRILTDLQADGDAVVLLESEQPVFHVTVARRYR
ncbi:MAG TPA: DUF5715 family protein [Rubricoccaceae bacterium]|nr:DUF5715 family protein [Rubricoccaceae bacterium]